MRSPHHECRDESQTIDKMIRTSDIFTVVALLTGFCCAVPQCPQNTLPFDYETCNIEIRSQCPTGFTCRKGSDPERPNAPISLCCDSADMTIRDWFVEAQIAPQVFPTVPMVALKTVQLPPIDQNTTFPAIYIGDEIVVISYPNYVTAIPRAIEFATAPQPGGFIHVMTIVDPGNRPFAVFLTYNTPSYGLTLLDTTRTDRGTTRLAAYVDNSTTVPKRHSYRAQYVVMVFRTLNPLYLDGSANKGFNAMPSTSPMAGGSLMGQCSDVTCLMTNSSVGSQLGQPAAGSLFYLTTRRSMFPSTHSVPRRDSSTALGVMTFKNK